MNLARGLSCAWVVAVSLAACGDNHRPATVDAGPDGPVVDACPALVLGNARLQFNQFNQVTGVRYPIVGGGAALEESVLVVELYDESTGGGLPPLATGSFDLATAPNDNLATCQHCAYVARPRADGSLELQYFQATGTIDVTKVTDPLELEFAASVTAQLRAATADEAGTSTFVPEGACRRIEAAAFDTTPVAAPCTTLTDCPNELLQVCDPRSQQCVPPQCNLDGGGCLENQACVPQLPTEFSGACYDICNPSGTETCGAGSRAGRRGRNPRSGCACARAAARSRARASRRTPRRRASTSCCARR